MQIALFIIGIAIGVIVTIAVIFESVFQAMFGISFFGMYVDAIALAIRTMFGGDHDE